MKKTISTEFDYKDDGLWIHKSRGRLTLDEIQELEQKLKDMTEDRDWWRAEAEKRQWVSVDNKLPENADDVIVCSEEGRVFSAYCWSYDKSWYFKEYVVCATEKVSSRITHWMPLPERPKESDTE